MWECAATGAAAMLATCLVEGFINVVVAGSVTKVEEREECSGRS